MASQGVAYDLRNAIHEKLSSLSFSYHDRAQTGQLLSRAVQDVERIRFLTGRAALRMVEGTVLLLSTFVALCWMNPRLALVALGTMPMLAWVTYRFGRGYRPLSLELQQQLAVLTTGAEEDLRGARIVKAFAQKDAKIEQFERENDRWFQLSARAARLRAFNVPLLELIASAGTMFIIWYGGSLVIRDQLTLGELVAFSTYLGLLFNPVRRMGVILTAFALAAAAGERIFEILDAKSEVEDAPDARPLPPVCGQVRPMPTRCPPLPATSAVGGRAPATGPSRRPRVWPTPTGSLSHCPMATQPKFWRGASTCRSASGSWSASPVPCSPTRACSSWTRPRPASTRLPKC